jgi:hypothetical protein
MADAAGALFIDDGGRLVPSDLARGPWDPDALHGGPPAALVVRAAERVLATAGPPEGDPPQIARLTLELLRPVPFAALETAARIVRPGRKVMLVEATVRAAGSDRDVARGVVLAIRRQPQPLPARVRDVPPPAGPDGLAGDEPFGDWVAFHNAGVEMRYTRGAFRVAGPASVWMRLRVPVVAGEATSPAMRAAAVADFGNGVSSELEMGVWRFINPDLTVHLARPPDGEWINLDARTVLGDQGAGLAESAIADHRGVVGRAVQSLIVEGP